MSGPRPVAEGETVSHRKGLSLLSVARRHLKRLPLSQGRSEEEPVAGWDDSALKRHSLFLAINLILIAGFWSVWKDLYTLSGEAMHYSHIVLIPFVAAYLFWNERRTIFERVRWGVPAGLIVGAIGLVPALSRSALSLGWDRNDILSFAVFSLLVTWAGGFALCYGIEAARKGVFPILFLFLIIPIPSPLLETIVGFLQRASTEVVAILFRVSGMPTEGRPG